MSSMAPENFICLAFMKEQEALVSTNLKLLASSIRAKKEGIPSEDQTPENILKNLLDIYTAVDKKRNDEILPDEKHQENEIHSIRLFIHNTKNKVVKIQTAINKENWDNAEALLDSVFFREELIHQENQNLGYLASHFDKIKEALCHESPRNIEISVDDSVNMITGSPELLTTIHSAIENLLMNAIQYTKGNIYLSLREDKEKEGDLVITLRDESTTEIPNETLKRINGQPVSAEEPSVVIAPLVDLSTVDIVLDDELDEPLDSPEEKDPLGSWGMGLRQSFSELRAYFEKNPELVQTPIEGGKNLYFSLPYREGKLLDRTESKKSSSLDSVPPTPERASTAAIEISPNPSSVSISPGSAERRSAEDKEQSPAPMTTAHVLFQPKPISPCVSSARLSKPYAFVLIEDQPINCAVVKRLAERVFKENPWEFQICESAEEFLTKKKDGALDVYKGLLIGVDSTLPGCSGKALLSLLKEDSIHQKAIFVWYSENDQNLSGLNCKTKGTEKNHVFTVSNLKEWMSEVKTKTDLSLMAGAGEGSALTPRLHQDSKAGFLNFPGE